jgi:hypothetical protein
MSKYIAPVPLEKAYRLINHGPTVLVSARHGGVDDVMAAAWACALDIAGGHFYAIGAALDANQDAAGVQGDSNVSR